MNKCIFVLIVAVIAGCATPTEKQHVDMSQKQVCCNAISQFQFQIIAPGEFVQFDMGGDGKVYKFGDEKSYFIAVEIPSESNNFVFKSYFNGAFVGQYFQPIALLLDKNLSEVETRVLEMRFTRPGWKEEDHMLGNIRLKPDNPVKYVVIYTSVFTDTNPVAQLPPSVTVYMTGGIPVAVADEGVGIELDRSPTGRIKFKPEKVEEWGSN